MKKYFFIILLLVIILLPINKSKAVLLLWHSFPTPDGGSTSPSTEVNYCGHPNFEDPKQCKLNKSSVRACDPELDFISKTTGCICINGTTGFRRFYELAPEAICYPEKMKVFACTCPIPVPECTEEDFIYSDWWSKCKDGVQTRNFKKINTNCSGGVSPKISRSCVYDVPVPNCINVDYSDWSPCIDGFKNRVIIISSPSGCTLTNTQKLATSQECFVEDEEIFKENDSLEKDEEINDQNEEKRQEEPKFSGLDKEGDELRKEVLKRERDNQATKYNTALTSRLSGRILLQVEEKGEAWYVEPQSNEKYFMGRPADAFSMMREFGLGISEENFSKFEDEGVPARFAGKILLRVEANGEAYYINPVDLEMYFLNRPDDAFKIMRELALGINNTNLRQIPLGE